MKRSASIFERLFRLGFFVCFLWLTGCSPGDLPMAPDLTGEGLEVAGSGTMQTAPAGVRISTGAGIAILPRPLAKPAGSQKPLVREKLIRARKGGEITLTAKDPKTGVQFEVPAGALKEDTRIRMEVIGAGPSVSVHFGPSPLTFLKPCALTISMPKDGVNPDDLGGYLITEDGPEPVPYTVKVIGNRIIVTISVAHFSTFSPDDDDPDWNDGEEDDPPP